MSGTLSYGDILGNTQVGPYQTVTPDATATSWISRNVPDPQIQSDWTQTNTSSLDYIKNKPAIGSRTFNNPTRSLNTAFQISSSQDASVSYSVDISASLSLSGGQTGTVTLQYADDSGFTTNVKTVTQASNGNSGTLTIGLGLTQLGTAALSGMIPASKYVKIVTANTSGTPTFTYRNAQEVLL